MNFRLFQGNLRLLVAALLGMSAGCSDTGGSTPASDEVAGVAARAANPASGSASPNAPQGARFAGASTRVSQWTSMPAASNGSIPAGVAPRADGVIVKFRSTGPTRVSDSVDAVLGQRRSFRAATADGSASLDAIMQRHGVSRAHAFSSWRQGLSTAAAGTQAQARFARLKKVGKAAASPATDLTNVFRLEVSGDAAAIARDFAQDPHVEYAQPNYVVKVNYAPNDVYFSSTGSFGQSYADLWGLHAVGASAAWNTARGQGIVVAVVDTGVDRNHVDMSPNIWSNPADGVNGIDDDHNGLIDDTWGWDFAYGDNDPMDAFGHGTHVAGIIAAQDNNATGVVGLAPDAKIMVLKGFQDSGSGDIFSLSQAILYAAEHGADVINNSWGCGGCPSNPVAEDAIKQAHSLGSVVVFSSGNESSDVLVGSPQNTPQTILVGAVDPVGQRSSFSNFGQIDVTAPGSGLSSGPPSFEPGRGILSLKSAVCDASMCEGLVVGTSYVRQAGTSMAAPYASGLAALILTQHPTYTPEQVRQVLRSSADDLNGNQFDPELGYGRINALDALGETAPPEVLIESKYGVTTLDSLQVVGTARGTGFVSWKLESGAGDMPATWTTIAQSSTQASSAVLGTWNASTAPEGMNTLRLTTQTSSGKVYEDRQGVSFNRFAMTAPVYFDAFRAGDNVQIMGTTAIGNFAQARIGIHYVSASGFAAGLVPGAQVTLVGGGTTPVKNGLIGTWNTTGIAANEYIVKLRVLSQSGSELSAEARVVVDPLIHVGWPRQLAPSTQFLGIFDTTTLADVNRDGRSELVVGYGPTVQIFQHDGTQLAGWPQAVDRSGGTSETQFSPAVGDITGDGLPEVVTSNIKNEILAFSASGALLSGFPKAIGTSTRNRLALADIDGNGVKDIVAADDTGSIKVLKSNGTLVTGFPMSAGSGTQSSPSVADLDRNGTQEIVTLIEGVQISVVTNTGSVRSGWPKAGAFYYKAIADIDGDGDVEIISASDQVYAYHHDGTSVSGWPKSLGVAYPTSLVAGDINRDGRADIVAGMASQTSGNLFIGLNAWSGTGQMLSGWPHIRTDLAGIGGGYQAAMLADLNNDGQVDVAAAHDPTFPQTLDVLGAGGLVNSELTRPIATLGPGWESGAASADMDGDGLLEGAFITGLGKMFVWDLPAAVNGLRPSPMFQQNPEHTGAPIAERTVLPARIEAESYARFSDFDPTINHGASGSPHCNRNNGVDSQATSDQRGVCSIGWTRPNEWLEYDVWAQAAGNFDFAARLGSGITGQSIRILVDGATKGTLNAPNVGWSSFQTRKLSNVALTAGAHVVRVEFVTGETNLNYLDIRPSGTAPRLPLPWKIEAEDYHRASELSPANQGASGSPQCNNGSSVDLWHTADQNGVCNVGWTQAGEWLEYDVIAPQAGHYEYVLRASSGLAGKRLRLAVDGVQQTSFTVNNSGWDSYQDYGSDVFLSQGNHTLRVLFDTGDVNLNSLNLVPIVTTPARVQDSGYARFFDTDLANNGAAGSPLCDQGDGVDFAATTDNGGLCNIGWGQPGEWEQYSVRAGASGNWSIKLRVASGAVGKTVQVLVDGTSVGTFAVANNGWQVFQDLTVNVPSSNSAGQIRDVRLFFPQGGVDVNYLDFN